MLSQPLDTLCLTCVCWGEHLLILKIKGFITNQAATNIDKRRYEVYPTLRPLSKPGSLAIQSLSTPSRAYQSHGS